MHRAKYTTGTFGSSIIIARLLGRAIMILPASVYLCIYLSIYVSMYVSVNKISQEPLHGFSCHLREKLHSDMAQAD